MDAVLFGANAYDDNTYSLPAVRLENYYAEATPGRGRPYRLLPTPGLVPHNSLLKESCRGLFQTDGLIGGDILSANGGRLWRVNEAGTQTNIGTMASDAYNAEFAASQTQLVMTSGGTAYTVTGTSVTAVTIANATGSIVSCAEIAQRHLYLEDGTGRIHISDVANAGSVSAFVTAEAEPDNLYAITVLGDRVLAMGTQSIEAFFSTGDYAAPLATSPGGVIPRGIMGRAAWSQADFGLFIVGDDGIVYRFDNYTPTRISTNFIEREIERSAASRDRISMWTYTQGGHPMVGVEIPGRGTYVYDVATRSWHRRRRLNADDYEASHWVNAWGRTYAGSASLGKLYRADSEVYTENNRTVRRVATALVPIEDGRPRIKNLTIEAQAGVGLVSGQGSDPQIMLRVAYDGKSFGPEIMRSVGEIGDYKKKVVYAPLGRAEPPVLAFEIAVTDPVPVTIGAAKINLARP